MLTSVLGHMLRPLNDNYFFENLCNQYIENLNI